MAMSTSAGSQGDQSIPNGLRWVYLLHAIGGGIFGLTWFFTPTLWGTLVNWGTVDPTITRLYGGAIVSIAFSSWLGYRANAWSQLQILVVFDIALSVLTALAGLYEVLLADGPVFTWVIIAISVFFTLAFSYYYKQVRG